MYKIPVKIEGLQKRKRSSGILHILAGFFFLVTGSLTDSSLELDWLSITIGVASIFYGAMRNRIDPAAKWNHWLRLVQTAGFLAKGILLLEYVGTMTTVSLFVWAAVTLMLWFTEKKVFKPTELSISKEGISIPGFYTEHLIPWTLVNDLVVRPDFVTITRENLSYIQLELLADMDRKDLNRINEFAREQMAANKKKELTS